MVAARAGRQARKGDRSNGHPTGGICHRSRGDDTPLLRARHLANGADRVSSPVCWQTEPTHDGNSTTDHGADGGTLISPDPLPGSCTITVTGGTITLNNSRLDILGGNRNSTTTINFGTGSSGVIN